MMSKNKQKWTPYENDCPPQVPLEKWGRDHWGTFAYLVSVVTGRDGLIQNPKMRCNNRLHREFAHLGLGSLTDGADYPTRTKDAEVDRHDDWSCLEDMVSVGLIKAYHRVKYHDEIFGGSEARIELTDLGWTVAKALTRFKEAGGKDQDFVMPQAVAQ